ncbi:MAG: type II secretion system F family protein [Candidatus Omnitrophota bacterium]|nr:type II secretion system F family protein [Candidatus Omnitrophota bacterium]
MLRFNYIAKTRDSKTIKDIEDASSKEELIAKLKSRGLFIMSVSEAKSGEEKSVLSLLSFKRKGRRSSVKLQDIAFLARNLATTLSSGVTLLRSLEILSIQTESIKLGNILKNCGDQIKGGLSFKEAVAKYPTIFPPLWRAIVEVGEASGNLPSVLDKLADYLEMRMEFERKIKSALIYPCILMGAAIIAVFIFFNFILPKFDVIFKEFKIELPWPTQILFGISRIFTNHFVLVVLFFVLSGIGIYLFLKRPETKAIRDRLSLKLPLTGDLFFIFAIERFTSTMNILLESGLPLVYALEISARGVGNSVLEKNIAFVKDKIKDGASLSREFSKLNIFPILVSEMARIGEETGSMPEIFKKIAIHYNKELSSRVERLISAFEPIMILVIGVIIGTIVISLFLPLFKLATLGAGGG